MDGARLQGLIYKGRGKAAKHIGLPCQQYRPTLTTNPLSNPLAVINVAFNAADPTYTKPGLYGKPAWFADFDGRLSQVGDYLKRLSDGSFWFIAGQQQLLPIVVISCNRTVRISRQASATACGVGDYSGLQDPADYLGTPSSMWPASILLGGRALGAIGLPSDVKESGWRILLPPSVPVTINAGDIVFDDLDRRYAIESAEQSDLGWRLTVNEAHT